MGQRLRVLILLLVLSGAGILLGSLLSESEPESPETELHTWIQGIQGRVRVEVLNGSGVAGVAWDATRVLRESGFDVVLFDNAETYSADSSVVMDRVGNMDPARSVAEALGIAQVRSEPDSTRLVDVTVRLGPDWSSPRSVMEGDEDVAPWWDLRRLFRRGKSP